MRFGRLRSLMKCEGRKYLFPDLLHFRPVVDIYSGNVILRNIAIPTPGRSRCPRKY
jgi:hypothetical protein